MLSHSRAGIPFTDFLEVMTWPVVEWVSLDTTRSFGINTILEGVPRNLFPEVREQILILQKTESDKSESAQLARKNAWKELERLHQFKVDLVVTRSPTSLLPGETKYLPLEE